MVSFGREMKFIDFFAGIGGFRRGMELAGHECVGFCEWDKFATASYTSMHLITDEQRKKLAESPIKQRQKEILKEEYRNGEWYTNDIRTVDARCLPKADCWCAGFPCQDISVAGKQLGFDGNRSSLFFEIIRLIKESKEENRPEWLFLENVKNLLSVNRGWDFARVLFAMDEVGYDTEWGVLNSKDFGVPQNRERIFIVGHLRGRSGREVFPITRTTSKNSIEQIGRLGNANRDNPNRYRVYDSEGLAPTIGKMDGGGLQPHILLPAFCDLSKGEFKTTEHARCLKARYDAGITNRGADNSGVAIPVLTPDRTNKRQNGRRFKENGEPMFTLTAQDRHGVTVIDDTQGFDGVRTYEDIAPTLRSQRHGLKVRISEKPILLGGIGEKNFGKQFRQGNRIYSSEAIAMCLNSNPIGNTGGNSYLYCIKNDKNYRIRKLTPKECFRLQGWTDDYFEKAQFVNSDSQLYKQAGNGVTVNVIKAIAEKF